MRKLPTLAFILVSVVIIAGFGIECRGSRFAVGDYTSDLGPRAVTLKLPGVSLIEPQTRWTEDFTEEYTRQIYIEPWIGPYMTIEDHGAGFYRSIEEWRSYQDGAGATWVGLNEREVEVAGTTGVMIFAKWDFDCDYWVDVCEGPDPGPLNQVNTVFVLDGRLY